MNVACYCRVSTEEQAKYGFSIQAQKDALIKYCNEHNYIYDMYVDEGISASSMKKRLDLQLMLNNSKKYDMILFTKLDRLSRNVLDANKINEQLKINNCTMKAIDEDDIDTSTADGTFIFNLKVSLAQREIEKTSERIKFVFKNKREKGQITCGTKKYGYDIIDKKYVINEKESQNIIDLFNFFISVNGNMQETYKFFVSKFNGKGYDAMQNYLKNTEWVGKYKLYRKNEYIDNYIPAIMSEELFNQAQLLIKHRPISTKTQSFPIFSGIVYCAECTHRFTKKYDNRTKKPTLRYICDNSSRYIVGTTTHKCSNNRQIREEKLEDFLLKNLEILAKEYIVKNTVKVKKHDNTQKINQLKLKMKKLKDLYLEDLIDKETYKIDYQNCKEEIAKLEIVEKEKDLTNITKIVNSNVLDLYNNLNNEEKHFFWINIIDKIYIFNGEVKEVEFL